MADISDEDVTADTHAPSGEKPGAEVNAISGDTETDLHTEYAINWLLSLPEGLGASDKRSLVKGFITGVFARNPLADSDRYGRDFGDGILMNTQAGFQLNLTSALGNNIINSETLEGAGEIVPGHGHLPLMMLIYLQSRFSHTFGETDQPLVSFCNEQGEILHFNRYGALDPVVEAMGFDPGQVKDDAATLGLVCAPVDWDSMASNIDDCYF